MGIHLCKWSVYSNWNSQTKSMSLTQLLKTAIVSIQFLTRSRPQASQGMPLPAGTHTRTHMHAQMDRQVENIMLLPITNSKSCKWCRAHFHTLQLLSRNQWWGVGVDICLRRGADYLHMIQLMPLHPKTPSSLVAWFKSRLILPFWYWLTQVVLEKRPLKGV